MDAAPRADVDERADGGDQAQGSPRTQQVVTTVIALYGRARPLPVAVLVRLLGDLGIEDSAARTALSRLKRRHVLTSSRDGSSSVYTLAPELEDTFREGDERIFAPRRATPDDDWVLVAFSVPEKQRHLRYRIRKTLTKHGFGTVSAALWIAPQIAFEAVRRDLARDALEPFVEFFAARSLARDELPGKVGEWWDLAELAEGYQRFYDDFGAVLDRWRAAPEGDRVSAEGFADYVTMVTAWRRFPYVDPGLPVEFLPDAWPGLAAEQLFSQLHGLLSEPAAQYAGAVADGSRLQGQTSDGSD